MSTLNQTIFLRGVVATGKNANGSLDGFAIFEIDGKPTNAISIGESLGKGLTLQSIGDESATLLYQGQKLEFRLSNSPELAARDLNVMLYCKTSGRAALAARSLADMGYLQVRSIEGGYDAWHEAGKPIARPTLPPFE